MLASRPMWRSASAALLKSVVTPPQIKVLKLHPGGSIFRAYNSNLKQEEGNNLVYWRQIVTPVSLQQHLLTPSITSSLPERRFQKDLFVLDDRQPKEGVKTQKIRFQIGMLPSHSSVGLNDLSQDVLLQRIRDLSLGLPSSLSSAEDTDDQQQQTQSNSYLLESEWWIDSVKPVEENKVSVRTHLLLAGALHRWSSEDLCKVGTLVHHQMMDRV